MVDVFISYRRAQRDKVEPIKDKLEALGLKVFFDIHGIDGGADFPTVIDTNLREAKVVLACWSPLYFARKPPPDWCMIECRFGLGRQKLVSVAVERFASDAPPVEMHDVNYLDLTDFDGRENHEGWQRTLRSLSRYAGRELGGTASGAPTPPACVRPVPTPTLPPPSVLLHDSAFPEMVRIPPGRFLMGSAPSEAGRLENESPQHEVRIEYAFALGKHAVTFAEWDAAIAAGAEITKPSDEGWGRDRRPVINVNWYDVDRYIAWLNSELGLEGCADAYRLPSEAEWEYACRAGTTTPFSFGATISPAQANYRAGSEGEFRRQTTPVGAFPANAYGLHEMHGNVWECCADAWNNTYNGAPSDGSARRTGDRPWSQVLRGGSWYVSPEDLRSAFRLGVNPSMRTNVKGFRVARTL